MRLVCVSVFFFPSSFSSLSSDVVDAFMWFFLFTLNTFKNFDTAALELHGIASDTFVCIFCFVFVFFSRGPSYFDLITEIFKSIFKYLLELWFGLV